MGNGLIAVTIWVFVLSPKWMAGIQASKPSRGFAAARRFGYVTLPRSLYLLIWLFRIS